MGIADSADEQGLAFEDFQVSSLPVARLNLVKDALDPGQAFPARRAEAARFSGKKLFQIGNHANRTGAVIKDNHQAGTHAATCLLDGLVLHG